MIRILKHVPHEGIGTLREAIESRHRAYLETALYAEPAPPDLHGCSGLIVMGGPMNVYEEEAFPFLRDEDRLLKEAFSRRLPVLGICLGAQLMAKAAGARVVKGAKKEIGWYGLHLEEAAASDCAFVGLPRDIEVFQWHGDTFELPPGAVRLASSSLFPNQAFRLYEGAYALQFHVEVTEEMVHEWIDVNGEELAGLQGEIDPVRIRTETHAKIAALARTAESLYGGLLARFC